MSRWWRAYDEAIDDPKLLLLSDRAHRAWFNLMCLASIGGGRLPERKVIELKLRLSTEKTKAVLGELMDAGLIETDGDALIPHNWNGRQYKSDVSTDRVKRFRNAKRNVSSNDDEAFQKRPQSTEADTEEEKKDAATSSRTMISAETELFRRGKEILGDNAGGVITKLVKSKSGDIALARAAIEISSTKQDPREYIGAIIRGRGSPEDLRAKGEAW